MTLFQIAPLIQAGLAIGVLALLVIKGSLSRASTRWFTLFVLGQMLWGLAVFGLRGSNNLAWALLWERFTPAAVSLTAISFYYFSKALARVRTPRWMTILTGAHILFSLASIPTPFVVEAVEVAGYGNTAIWGLGLIPWTMPIYLMMVLSLATLYHGFRSASTYTERNRLFLIIIAASVSVLGSLLDVAPVVGFDVPPATSWTNSLFFILAGVAILRYQLLDIQVTLQHRIAYLVRSLVILLVGSLAVLLVGLLGFPPWSRVPIAFILLLVAEPIWRKIDILLRSHLEKDLLSELQTLLTLETGRGTTSVQQIAETVTKLVQSVIRPSHCTFLALQDDYFRPIASLGQSVAPDSLIPRSHPLFYWLRSQPEPAFHQDLVVEPWYQSTAPQTLEPVTSLNAAIYVPLIERDITEGLLVVGPKVGSSIYSWQETAFLAAVGRQTALLLESIRLAQADQFHRDEMMRFQEMQRFMVEAREAERRTLASDIHDEPVQLLVGSLVRLNLIRDFMTSRPELVQQQIAHVTQSIALAEQSLRRIMRGVFPSLLQDLGLLAALEALCQDLGNSRFAKTPAHLSMTISGVPRSWNPPLSAGLIIYRFIQEGLRNALTHSGSPQIFITVQYGTENVTMEVQDNGRGINPERAASRRQEGHVGLLGLEERVGAVGGNMAIVNRPEGGARLWGEFPHQSPTPDPQAQWVFEYDFLPSSLDAAPGEEPVESHAGTTS